MKHRTRTVFLACAAYFLRFAAFGAFGPYISLWLKHSGHSTATIGTLYSIYRCMACCSPFLIGWLSDSYKCHRPLFALATFTNALSVASLAAFPSSWLWQCLILVLIALSESSSLLDAMIVRCLTWAGADSMAPRCRACGALAWCIVAPLYGIVAHKFGISTLFQCIYAPMLTIMLPFCMALPSTRAYAETHQGTNKVSGGETIQRSACNNESSKSASSLHDSSAHRESSENGLEASQATTDTTNTATSTPPSSLCRRLSIVLRSCRTLCILCLLFMVGLHFGIAFGFGFPYLESELHATGVQLGFTLTAQALLEVPLFQVATPLATFLGLPTALLVCMLSACVRFTGWVTVSNAWFILPFESGHGIAFALSFTTMALFAEEFTKLGLQATVLGAANSSQQAGSLIATMLWTLFITNFGMRNAFEIAAATFACASLPLLGKAPACCIYALQTTRHLWRECSKCVRRDNVSLLAPGTLTSSMRQSSTSTAAELSAASSMDEGPPDNGARFMRGGVECRATKQEDVA